MCGRFTRFMTWQQIHDTLRGVLVGDTPVWREPGEEITPSYNVAPTQMSPIVVQEGDELVGSIARWEFIPGWFYQPLERKAFTTFNAKVEEVTTKRTFKAALSEHRCLIPNNGFYEWKTNADGSKTPFWIRDAAVPVSFFGGLWNDWSGVHKGEPKAFRTFTVITCAPNNLVAPIHTRMPVMIKPEDFHTWLCGDAAEALKIAHDPYPSQLMTASQAHQDVGNVKNNRIELLNSA